MKMLTAIRNFFGMGAKTDFSKLVKEGAIIIDVRSKYEFTSGHVTGAINVPLDQLSDYAQKWKDKNKPMITCCASGMRSASAKSLLLSKGFSNVFNGGGWYGLQRKLSAAI